MLTGFRTTDLFVAGKGLGFYNANNLDESPLLLLPNIEFDQVVAAERGISATETRISVLALSTVDELYFLEGRRVLQPTGEAEVSFPIVSGLPIRGGVTQISSMFNKCVGASEIIYASNANENALHHLIRDPSTSSWNETTLQCRLIQKTSGVGASASPDDERQSHGISYPAYVTKISFTNSDGETVPAGYAVKISCESPLHVIVNDRSYTLDKVPREIQTDSAGQIEIVMRAHGLLGCPDYLVSMLQFCSDAEKGKVYRVRPAQRVLRMLSQIQSADDLKKARQTDGKPVFAPGSASDQDFESMGGMLGQFPDMMKSVSENSDSQGDDDTPVGKHVDYVIDEKGQLTVYKPKPEEPSWFENVLTTVGDALGDVIEFIERGFKTILRVVIRIAGPIIKLYLKLQDAVVGFVLKTAISVLRTVAHFLKATFGLDLGKLCGWLGFIFDVESIKKIQTVSLLSMFVVSTFCMCLTDATSGIEERYI